MNVSQLDCDCMKMLMQQFGMIVIQQPLNSLDQQEYSQFGSLLEIQPGLYNDYVPQYVMLYCAQAPREHQSMKNQIECCGEFKFTSSYFVFSYIRRCFNKKKYLYLYMNNITWHTNQGVR